MRELAAVLARAFDDDPVACWILVNARSRPGGLRKFFSIQLRGTYLPHGEVYTTPDHEGASLWTPPDAPHPGIGDLLRLVPMAPFIGRRLGQTVTFLQRLEAKRPSTPHWYLGVLGTEPALQGRGIGSALLSPVLARCDEEGLPAYLESSKDRNVPFYRRHGWEVTEELHAPGGGPTLWLMWREPKPAAV